MQAKKFSQIKLSFSSKGEKIEKSETLEEKIKSIKSNLAISQRFPTLVDQMKQIITEINSKTRQSILGLIKLAHKRVIEKGYDAKVFESLLQISLSPEIKSLWSPRSIPILTNCLQEVEEIVKRKYGSSQGSQSTNAPPIPPSPSPALAPSAAAISPSLSPLPSFSSSPHPPSSSTSAATPFSPFFAPRSKPTKTITKNKNRKHQNAKVNEDNNNNNQEEEEEIDNDSQQINFPSPPSSPLNNVDEMIDNNNNNNNNNAEENGSGFSEGESAGESFNDLIDEEIDFLNEQCEIGNDLFSSSSLLKSPISFPNSNNEIENNIIEYVNNSNNEINNNNNLNQSFIESEQENVNNKNDNNNNNIKNVNSKNEDIFDIFSSPNDFLRQSNDIDDDYSVYSCSSSNNDNNNNDNVNNSNYFPIVKRKSFLNNQNNMLTQSKCDQMIKNNLSVFKQTILKENNTQEKEKENIPNEHNHSNNKDNDDNKNNIINNSNDDNRNQKESIKDNINKTNDNKINNNNDIEINKKKEIEEDIKKLNITKMKKDIPFLSFNEEYNSPLAPVKLIPIPQNRVTVKNQMISFNLFTFTIPLFLFSSIKANGTDEEKGSLQIRLCVYSYSHFTYDISKSVNIDQSALVIRLNDKTINLSEKMTHFGVDISTYCKAGFNQLQLFFQSSFPYSTHGIGIRYVNYHPINQIMNYIKLKNLLPIEHSLYLLKKSFSDDEIEQVYITVSLICSMSQMRIEIPVKSFDCSHLQCFDLDTFLQLNKRNPKWKCPVCSKIIYFNNLFIDQYFANILKEIGDNEDEESIQIFPDSSWRFFNNNNTRKRCPFSSPSSQNSQDYNDDQSDNGDEVVNPKKKQKLLSQEEVFDLTLD